MRGDLVKLALISVSSSFYTCPILARVFLCICANSMISFISTPSSWCTILIFGFCYLRDKCHKWEDILPGPLSPPPLARDIHAWWPTSGAREFPPPPVGGGAFVYRNRCSRWVHTCPAWHASSSWCVGGAGAPCTYSLASASPERTGPCRPLLGNQGLLFYQLQ